MSNAPETCPPVWKDSCAMCLLRQREEKLAKVVDITNAKIKKKKVEGVQLVPVRILSTGQEH